MPSTEARIIDIRQWRAAHPRAARARPARPRAARSSSAPLVIVVIVLILAGLVGFAAPIGADRPTIELVQWDGLRP